MKAAVKIRFLKKLARSGPRAAYLGTPDIPGELAGAALVTLGLDGSGPADISLTGATAPAARAGKTQEARVGSSCKRAFLPSVLYIAGVFTHALNVWTGGKLAPA
jgi:hypothetical protein